MPFVGDHCKNLTSLECEFNIISLIDDADQFIEAFTQLERLKCIVIKVNNKLFNKTINLSAIINSLPKEINQIHLFSKPLSNYERTVLMTFKKFRNLRKLSLHGFSLDNIFQEIAEKTTLVHLNIRPYNVHKKFSLFNKLVNLEYIDLRMWNLSPTGKIDKGTEDLSTQVLNTIFCTCRNLKHLNIRDGLYDVAKIPLKKWINFRNLEYLGISANIMPDLANTIVKYCKNLKHLRIHNPYRFMNDTALKKLTKLENLECLILLKYVKLSEESIIAISNNCKKLKRLEIPRCIIVPSIDGDPLTSPSVLDQLSKLQYLEHLNLYEAKNLEDSTIIAIANNCKNLKSLNIYGCMAITETALVALINLKNLQKLDVSILDISDSFIIKLKGLKELCCIGCKKLTDAGIIQLIKNNPDLEVIYVWCIENFTIDLVIAADQATRNRTNGIILHIEITHLCIREARSIINSQWLVIK